MGVGEEGSQQGLLNVEQLNRTRTKNKQTAQKRQKKPQTSRNSEMNGTDDELREK